jgi:hydrogenase nickel incorporation protein HypA/HybF
LFQTERDINDPNSKIIKIKKGYNWVMHELAVTESILNIAVKHAQQAQAARVTDLYLVIGRLASIVDDSIQFYWDIISSETVCQGAKLHFKRVPAELLCLSCQQPYTLDDDLCPCPNCGSSQVKVTSGDQFWLDSIEIQQ